MDNSVIEDIDIHLGKRVRRRRTLLGMTQQELASACGVRFQQIQKYECAANRISASRLWKLAEALKVPVAYFYDGYGDIEPLTGSTEEPCEATDETWAALSQVYGRLAPRKKTLLIKVAQSMESGETPSSE